MAYLKVIEGSLPGQLIELTGDRVVIGRHPKCQIVLDNAAVSRHHAQILLSHGRYFLEDLRSRNGTLLNQRPVAGRTELHDGDEFDICEVVLRFHRNFPVEDDDFELDESPGKAKGAADASTTQVGFPAPGSGDSDDSDGSSIISTLKMVPEDVDSDFRVSVNPETKLRGVLEISRALRGELDLDAALTKVLECLFHIFPQADEAFALLNDEETGVPTVRAALTRREGEEGFLSRTIVERAFTSRAAILSEDTQRDERFDSSESLAMDRGRSLICVPLLDVSDQPLGVIQLSTRSLTHPFNQDDLDLLLSVASQAASTIEKAAMHAALVTRRELERDLEFATQIQLSFLPHTRPEIDGYQFADFYEAAQSVGGDSFDYIQLPRGRLAISIADVAGKGVPAALLMARLSSATRYHLLTETTVDKAMQGLNIEFATGGVGHRFVTGLLTILNPKTHQFRIANAGHLPPLVRNPENQVHSIGHMHSGMPLGVDPKQVYRQTDLTLQPGEMLLMFTDGITEAANADGKLFGADGLERALAEAPDDADETLRHILTRLEEFAGKETARDDICMVCIRRTK